MTQARRPAGVLPFLVGALTAFAGGRVFAPRARTAADPFSVESGRGGFDAAPSVEAMRAGYEPHDARGGSLARIMLIFAVSAVSGVTLMVLLLGVLHRRDTARDAGLTAEQRAPVTPPLPHLQADPVGELGALRARQDARLHGYARLNADTARIPIERAMQLVAGQSLDAHATPDAPAGGETGK